MPSKKLSVVIGFVPIPMRLDKATESADSKTHAVCLGGHEGQPPHDPIRVKQFNECPTCAHSASSVWGFPDRAVENPDGSLVVLTSEDLKDAAGDPIKEMHLEFHPREAVYGASLPSGTVNNLRPDKGGEKGYALLRDELAARPDVVAVAVWAHVSKNQLWVIEVVGNRLVASSRCWPEDMRPEPEITAPTEEIPEAERAMFAQIVEAKVSAFDLEKYQDTARKGIQELLATRQPVPVQTDGKSNVTNVDFMAALTATLEAAKPLPEQKKPAKKAAAKRAPAKKKTAAA